jgi:predicted nucleotide-binding protein (sugar kinase/HSP70/actin superfamily)
MERIVELWALGFSAQETRDAFETQQKITISLNTIYKYRHSLTAQNLIEELLRNQERAILKADTENPEAAMKYRNELLKILLPQRIEAYAKVEEHVTTTTINTNLRDYEWALEEATRLNIQSNLKAKQLDTAQATSEADPVSAPEQ